MTDSRAASITGLPAEPQTLHETDGWLVLAKPPGWHSVAPGRRARAARGEAPGPPDVESWLRATRPWARDLPEGGLVHRLDLETTGCLLVARDTSNQIRLRTMVRDGRIGKTYRALLLPGLPDSGEFTLYFSSRRTRSPKVTVRERGESRESGRCAWRTLSRSRDAQCVEVEIIGPGRRHQIRAGFARLGHPLLGDELYGGPAWVGGLALHAARITVDGIVIDCPEPSTWPACRTTLGGGG